MNKEKVATINRRKFVGMAGATVALAAFPKSSVLGAKIAFATASSGPATAAAGLEGRARSAQHRMCRRRRRLFVAARPGEGFVPVCPRLRRPPPVARPEGHRRRHHRHAAASARPLFPRRARRRQRRLLRENHDLRHSRSRRMSEKLRRASTQVIQIGLQHESSGELADACKWIQGRPARQDHFGRILDEPQHAARPGPMEVRSIPPLTAIRDMPTGTFSFSIAPRPPSTRMNT